MKINGGLVRCGYGRPRKGMGMEKRTVIIRRPNENKTRMVVVEEVLRGRNLYWIA